MLSETFCLFSGKMKQRTAWINQIESDKYFQVRCNIVSIILNCILLIRNIFHSAIFQVPFISRFLNIVRWLLNIYCIYEWKLLPAKNDNEKERGNIFLLVSFENLSSAKYNSFSFRFRFIFTKFTNILASLSLWASKLIPSDYFP